MTFGHHIGYAVSFIGLFCLVAVTAGYVPHDAFWAMGIVIAGIAYTRTFD